MRAQTRQLAPLGPADPLTCCDECGARAECWYVHCALLCHILCRYAVYLGLGGALMRMPSFARAAGHPGNSQNVARYAFLENILSLPS